MIGERSARARAYVLLVLVTLVWGCTFPLVKAALREVSPLLFNLLRMVLASLVLLAVHRGALRSVSRPQLTLSLIAGVCLALGYELQTVGLTYTTPSRSAFLTGLVVVFVPLLSLIPGLRSPDTPRPFGLVFVGAAVGFLGVVLLTAEPGAGWAPLAGMHTGEWLSLGCALAFALHLLMLTRANRVPARTLGTLQIAFAAAAMALFLPLEQRLRLHWTATVVLALLVTAILATAVAFTIQSWAQQHLAASHTALIFTLEPVFAYLTSLVFFGEHLGPRSLAGAGLILAGIVLAGRESPVATETNSLPILP